VVLWVVASLVLAAGIAPWLYQGGREFAELAQAQGYTGVAGWLGMACRRATFGRFFNRSLLLAALILLPVMFRRLRALRHPGERVWPGGAPGPGTWQSGAAQGLLGAVIACGAVCGLGVVLTGLGAFTAAPVVPGATRLLSQAVLPAVVVSVVEEWLFRGLLLGLWLRVAQPLAAALGSSLVFAFLHFLAPPGDGMAEPLAALAGFRHLGGILLHFTDPRFVVADFLTLFTIGWILAGARLRTGRLWLCMGMHSGWVIAFKVFHLTHVKVVAGPLAWWWIGDNLRSGLLPLAALGLSTWICHLVLRRGAYQSKVTPA
jgi:membrane protease YdiL (CAAX protease family)